MKRFVAHVSPTLVSVLGLTGLWLLLNQTVALAHVVLGTVLALGLAWATSTLRPLRASIRRMDVVAVLLLVVLKDIVISNFTVARIVLGLTRDRKLHAGFLRIPLELRDPHGLAALAAIITSTPGTVWAGISADGGTLTLHVLDLTDEDEAIRTIKQRYEAPLRRIFE